MNWLGHVKELETLESEADRQRVHDEAQWQAKKALGVRWILCCILTVGGLVSIVAWAVNPILASWLGRYGLDEHVCAVTLLGSAGGGMLISRWLFRRRYLLELRRCVRDWGIPLCLHCGYDLRGQTEPRCAECGEGFDPNLLEIGFDDVARVLARAHCGQVGNVAWRSTPLFRWLQARPECRHLGPIVRRQIVSAIAKRYSFGGIKSTVRVLVFLLLLCGSCTGSVAVSLASGTSDWIIWSAPVWTTVGIIGAAFVAIYGIIWLYDLCRRGVALRAMRLRLCEVGLPVCLECGWDLRGYVGPTCGGCGQAIEADVLKASQPDQPDVAGRQGASDDSPEEAEW